MRGQAVSVALVHRLVASMFGAGLLLRRLRGSDAGSGTVGGLVALPFSLLIGATWGWVGQLMATLLVAMVAYWSTAAVVASEGDAGWIVVDEAAGTFVATIGLLGWPAVVAFVVFRVADITKRPFPGVLRADSIAGASGVVLDDLVAGLYALAIGHLLSGVVFRFS